MLISEFQIEFSYNQFLVYDTIIKLPGNEWTEDHFNQGFARRDSSVGFGTLLQFGSAHVQVFNNDYTLDMGDERVIKVPFHSSSGKISVEGPEENLTHTVIIQPGHYQLTSAQRTNHEDETLLIRLYFLRNTIPSTKSEILIGDTGLAPSQQLLETAEIATFG